jgi:hypothetical protein
LSFSARWSWVTLPVVASFGPVDVSSKTSMPLVSPGETNAMTMPMFSYQLACWLSYTAFRRSLSPDLTRSR